MKRLEIVSLEKGWIDRDEVLLHAAFQCLVDYIEKENPGKFIDWNWNREHKFAWKEMKSLYKWWTKIRPKRKDPIYEVESPPWETKKETYNGKEVESWVRPDKKKYSKWYKACEKSHKLEVKWYKEDQKNLHRLIDIRHYLWT